MRDILIRIRGNASEALAAFRSVGAGLSAMRSTVTSATGGLGSALTAPFRSVASILDSTFRITQQSVSTLLGGLTRLGIGVIAIRELGEAAISFGRGLVSANVTLERFNVGFVRLLGSQHAATAFFAQLRQFGAQTSFELEQLIPLAQRLLAVGFAADTVIPSLRAIGDAVAAFGGSAEMIDRVTLAISQMATRGRVSASEMLQLTEAGIPAWQILADQLGITTGQLQDMVSKGLVPASQAIPLLLQGLTETFGGAMAEQAKTFGGILSNIADSFFNLRAILGQGLFNVLKPQLEAFLQTLQSPQLASALAFIGEGLGRAVQAGIAALQRLIAAFSQLGSRIYASLNQLVGGVPQFIGALVAAFAPLGQALAALLEGDFHRAAQLVGTFVSTVASLIVAGLANLAGDLFTGGFNTIAAYADGLIAGAVRYVTAALNYITGLIASFLQGFSPPKQGRLSTIDTWFGPVLDAYLSGWTDADWGVLDRITGRIADAFASLVRDGRASIADAGRIVLGTDGQAGLNQLLAQAIDDIARHGRVTGDALIRIQGLLGEQYQDLFAEIRTNLESLALDRQIRELQARLQGLRDPAARQALDDALSRAQQALRTARDPRAARAAREQIAVLTEQQRQQDRQRSQVEAQIQALEAQRQLISDQLAGQQALARLRERELTFLERITAAQERLAGGGGGGGADPAAREAQRRAEAEFRYRLAIADTAGQLALYEQRLQDVEAGSEDYFQIQTEIHRLNQQLAREQQQAADQAVRDAQERTEAEWDYRFAIADNETKVAMLRDRIAEVGEESAEGFRLRTQLAQLEGRIQDEAAAEHQRRLDAEFAYQLAIADTAGKIALYQQKLQGVAKDSAEWWEIQTRIVELQRQLTSESERAAKAGGAAAKGGKGGAAAALGGLGGDLSANLGTALGTATGGIGALGDEIARVTGEAKAKWDALWAKVGEGEQRLADVRARAGEFLTTLSQTPVAQFLSGLIADVRGLALAFGLLQPQYDLQNEQLVGVHQRYSELAGTIRTVIGVIAGIAGSVAAGVGAFLVLQAVLGTIGGAVSLVGAAWTALSVALGSGGILGVLGTIVGFLGGPVTITLGLVAAAVAAFAYAWITNLGGVRDLVAPIIDNLVTLLSGVWTTLQANITAVWPAIQGAIDALKGAFASLVPVGTVIVGVLLGVLGGLAQAFTAIIPGAIQVFSGAVQIVAGVVQAVANTVSGLVALIVGLFTGDFSMATAFFTAAWQGIQNATQGVINVVIGLVNGFVGGIIEFFRGLWRTLVGNSIVPDLVNAIIRWFTTLVTTVLRAVTTWVGNLIATFLELKDQAVARALELKDQALARFTELKDQALARVTELKDQAIAFLGEMVTTGLTKAGEIKDGIIGRFGELKDQALAKFGEIRTGVETKLEEVLTFITGLPGRFEDAGRALIASLWTGIKNRFESLLTDARSLLGRLTDLLPGSEPKDPTSPLRNLARRGAAIIGNMQAGIDRQALSLDTAAQGLTTELAAMLAGVQQELQRRPLSLAVQAGALGTAMQPNPAIMPPVTIEDKRTVVIQPPPGASLEDVRRIAQEELVRDREALVQLIPKWWRG